MTPHKPQADLEGRKVAKGKVSVKVTSVPLHELTSMAKGTWDLKKAIRKSFARFRFLNRRKPMTPTRNMLSCATSISMNAR